MESYREQLVNIRADLVMRHIEMALDDAKKDVDFNPVLDGAAMDKIRAAVRCALWEMAF